MTTTGAPVADLDRRFYAFALDRAVAWTTYALAALAAWWWLFREDSTLVGVAVVAAVLLVVSLLMAVLTGSQGVTPGKAALGLRVVDHADGTPIGVGRALVRGLILGAGTLPMFGLGTATLAWTAVEDRTRERRGWHDQVARSIVVDVRPRTVAQETVDDRPRHVVNLTALRLMPVRAEAVPTGDPPSAPPRPRPSTPTPTPPVAPPLPTAVAPRWRVSFDSGETMVVEGLGLVGRRPEGRSDEPVRHVVPLASENMSISKTHAQFHLAGDGTLVVMDRGSTNGSILVRQGVSRDLPPGKPATLLEGDRVLFGDREMRVTREQV